MRTAYKPSTTESTRTPRQMTEPIKIFRGDDTDFIGNKVIEITLETDIDLSGITADFLLCGFKQHFESETVASKRLEIVISHEETKRFPLGRQLGTLVLKSADGKIKHVDTQIEFFVTNKTGFPMFCGDEQIKTRFGLKIKWDDIRDTPTTLEGYGITDAVKSVNGKFPDEDGNVEVETGGGGTSDYNDLKNKPSINGKTLLGNKTAEALGLATAEQGAKADTALQNDDDNFLALKQFYLEEKRKIDPRFGVAGNVSVVIDTNDVRHEIVTEGVIVGYELKNALGLDPGVNIYELYLAPAVSGLDADLGDTSFQDVMTIVAYGNITTIGQDTFWTSYALELLSFAASTQTADVANNTVDFSLTARRFTIGLPRDIYGDDAAMEKFYGWDLDRYVFAPLDNGAFTPVRNPYIVDTDTGFIVPVAQFDCDYRSRWDGPLSEATPLNICGASGMPDFTMTLDTEPSFGVISASDIRVVAGEYGIDFYNGATIEVALRDYDVDNAAFVATKAGSNDNAFDIQRGNVTVSDENGDNIMPFPGPGPKLFGPILQSFVFRANQGGCTVQWMKNLGYSIHSELLPSNYTLSIGQLKLFSSEGGSPVEFYALRIYDAMLTDEQVIRHCALDAGRFGLQ